METHMYVTYMLEMSNALRIIKFRSIKSTIKMGAQRPPIRPSSRVISRRVYLSIFFASVNAIRSLHNAPNSADIRKFYGRSRCKYPFNAPVGVGEQIRSAPRGWKSWIARSSIDPEIGNRHRCEVRLRQIARWRGAIQDRRAKAYRIIVW